jgi:hypothetical protein
MSDLLLQNTSVNINKNTDPCVRTRDRSARCGEHAYFPYPLRTEHAYVLSSLRGGRAYLLSPLRGERVPVRVGAGRMTEMKR